MNLDIIQVADPCTVDWQTMSGNDRVRHCNLCEKNVYDLSTLSRSAAEALIEAHEGKLCVRFYRRADGTVQTADCTPIRQRLAAAARKTRQRLVATCSLLFAMAGLSTLAVRLAHASAPESAVTDVQIISGGMSPPSTLPTEPSPPLRTMGIIAAPPATRPTTNVTLMGEIGPPQKTPPKIVGKPYFSKTHK